MDWLLNHKADVNAQGRHGYTPLHSAAAEGQAGQLQAFQMLIEHNADIHIRNDFGLTVLHVAAASNQRHRDHINIMQVLLDHGADPNAQDNNSSTPLHHSSWWQTGDYAPHYGTVEGTRLLLKHGAIIDAEDNEGRTPLQLALEYGHEDIVTCLKKHGTTW